LTSGRPGQVLLGRQVPNAIEVGAEAPARFLKLGKWINRLKQKWTKREMQRPKRRRKTEVGAMKAAEVKPVKETVVVAAAAVVAGAVVAAAVVAAAVIVAAVAVVKILLRHPSAK
jgi:Flp pilus assembly protein TadB